MANNRIFLVYEPTGRAVCLGKRMAWGWYGVLTDIGEKLQILYDHVREEGSDQDAFRVVTRDEIVSYGEMDPDGLLTLVELKPRECRESEREDRWSKLCLKSLLAEAQLALEAALPFVDAYDSSGQTKRLVHMALRHMNSPVVAQERRRKDFPELAWDVVKEMYPTCGTCRWYKADTLPVERCGTGRLMTGLCVAHPIHVAKYESDTCGEHSPRD